MSITYDSGRNNVRSSERVVLRIDNVPSVRLITMSCYCRLTCEHLIGYHPSRYSTDPVERVHVLLYRKGKMMTYAFAEMADENAEKAALRCSPNSVMGKGKRVRRVAATQAVRKNLCER